MEKIHEQINFQIPKDLKINFIRVTEKNDMSVSQALRGFIRNYINSHKEDNNVEQ